MCGRTSLAIPQSVVESRFEAKFLEPVLPRYNIAPGEDLAVIRHDAPTEIDHLRWGLVPSWVDAPEDWPKPINARAETLADTPSFRSAFAKRRCLVLADGFYEWAGARGSKRPFRIQRADGDPFAFAGVWETWAANGDRLETVAVITTEANATVRRIHDRMPVILEPPEERHWLADAEPTELRSLLDPYPDDPLEAYEISTAINDPGYDDPAVLEPVDAGRQSGLDRFE